MYNIRNMCFCECFVRSWILGHRPDQLSLNFDSYLLSFLVLSNWVSRLTNQFGAGCLVFNIFHPNLVKSSNFRVR